MHTIEYKLAADDIVAYSQMHITKSGLLEKSTRDLYLWHVVFYLMACLMLLAYTRNGIFFGIVVVPGIVISPLSIPYFRRRTLSQIMTNVRSSVEKSQKGILGLHRISLGETAIENANNVAKCEWKYNGVDGITENQDYVFIILNESRAFVIPRRGIDPTNLTAFLEALRTKLQNDPNQNPVASPALSSRN